MRSIKKIANTVSHINNRTIVAGDFNGVAWARGMYIFKSASQLLDPRIGHGQFNTINAAAGLAVDHVFISSHFKVVNLKRLSPVNSDHFPLLIELSISDIDAMACQTTAKIESGSGLHE